MLSESPSFVGGEGGAGQAGARRAGEGCILQGWKPFRVVQSRWKERQEIGPNRQARNVLGEWRTVLIMISSLDCVLREWGAWGATAGF